mmetsp:Transcript_24857/g.74692  ORF Transcript_24857/g.74692 Transcript_24857/m.74692 type:complete len:274 (+) Transcript_24857:1037-1858(+)
MLAQVLPQRRLRQAEVAVHVESAPPRPHLVLVLGAQVAQERHAGENGLLVELPLLLDALLADQRRQRLEFLGEPPALRPPVLRRDLAATVVPVRERQNPLALELRPHLQLEDLVVARLRVELQEDDLVGRDRTAVVEVYAVEQLVEFVVVESREPLLAAGREDGPVDAPDLLRVQGVEHASGALEDGLHALAETAQQTRLLRRQVLEPEGLRLGDALEQLQGVDLDGEIPQGLLQVQEADLQRPVLVELPAPTSKDAAAAPVLEHGVQTPPVV